ncbi:eukaryotic aspartyl protease domain-containing protein [Ditylenchus destructor]|nr:eukaryotic aspartyl protease domain-containing protein [Ditylenchus destructor]
MGVEEEEAMDNGPNMRCMANGRISLEQLNWWMLAGTIAVGTPRQEPFYVIIDPFERSELVLIDTDADLSDENRYLPHKTTFNSSASMTYLHQKNCFAYETDTIAHFGSDYVQFGESAANVTFVLMDHVTYDILELPIDGYLGLAANDTRYNISFFSQIQDQLDQPIVSMWSNMSFAQRTGSAEVTLGAEDTDRCEQDWTYYPVTPRKALDYYYQGYGVQLTAFTAEVDGLQATFKLNKTLILDHRYNHAQMPFYLKYFFANASNAVFNETIGLSVVDCDVSKHGNVTFHLEGSRTIIFYPPDYVAYLHYLNVCILHINGYADDRYDYITVPFNFWNGHCFAYNHDTNEIGLADSRKDFRTNAR